MSTTLIPKPGISRGLRLLLGIVLALLVLVLLGRCAYERGRASGAATAASAQAAAVRMAEARAAVARATADSASASVAELRGRYVADTSRAASLRADALAQIEAAWRHVGVVREASTSVASLSAGTLPPSTPGASPPVPGGGYGGSSLVPEIRPGDSVVPVDVLRRATSACVAALNAADSVRTSCERRVAAAESAGVLRHVADSLSSGARVAFVVDSARRAGLTAESAAASHARRVATVRDALVAIVAVSSVIALRRAIGP